VTEKRDQQLISTLYIEKADMHHAGKFTCSPSYAKPDTVTLHVIDGKKNYVSSMTWPITTVFEINHDNFELIDI